MKKIVRIFLLTIVSSIVFTGFSLFYFGYGPIWDEAGSAYRGFPFEMVEWGPFYWGFETRTHEYVVEHINGITPTMNWANVGYNFICYSVLVLFLLVIGTTVIKGFRNLRSGRRNVSSVTLPARNEDLQ